MRLFAFVTALFGLFLMSYGIWGLQAPKKIEGVLSGARVQFFSVSRAATQEIREKFAQQPSEPGIDAVAPSSDDDDKVPFTIEEKYDKYLKCLESAACPGFSRDNEASYYADLREEIHGEIRAYYEYLREHPFSIQEKDRQFAIRLLRDDTPDVQVEALNILGLFPPSQENLKAMAPLISGTRDDGVLSAGLDVLMRYKGDKQFDRDIAEMLSRQIQLGLSDFTAKNAAKRLLPFINENNIDTYRKLKSDLEYYNSRYGGLQADRLKELNATLREYERDRLFQR